jgi:hypothetical protein
MLVFHPTVLVGSADRWQGIIHGLVVPDVIDEGLATVK